MAEEIEKTELVNVNFELINREFAKVIVGQESLIRNIFISLLVCQHEII